MICTTVGHMICTMYSGQRLNQYNSGDFSIVVQIFISLLQITGFQVNKEKLLINSFSLFLCLCIHTVEKLGRNKKFKSKVVIIVLIYTTTTVGKITKGKIT